MVLKPGEGLNFMVYFFISSEGNNFLEYGKYIFKLNKKSKKLKKIIGKIIKNLLIIINWIKDLK